VISEEHSAVSAGQSGNPYNNADQLLTENGVTYTYDPNGNLTSKTEGTGTTTYSWNYEDKLVKVTAPTVVVQRDSYARKAPVRGFLGGLMVMADGLYAT
jgi:YD repeat-containing protein